ncbi:MAG: SDR family NAD(P)-dependent oxidoreductase [Xanthomonadales bacterium]|nr:SDR family NAD(P)-dependent oxidoreductase [Xanthomonadales bacterium]
MTGNLMGKTAFVTGAAQGLGAAIAHAMHAAGARVILTDVCEAVEKTAAEMKDTGADRVFTANLDVRDIGAFEKTFTSFAERTGGIDIVVNNAAVTVIRNIWEIDLQEWDDVLATNLRSVFFGCQIAGRHLKDKGWGRIINLTSLAGQQPSRVAGAHYAASKAGIISITKNFAQALAGTGVTVNALAPAAIRTPIMDTLPTDRIEALTKAIPVGRVGDPAEVGAAGVFLASDHASFITGTTIDINGGLYMR